MLRLDLRSLAKRQKMLGSFLAQKLKGLASCDVFRFKRMAMSDTPESNDDRPCLHCLIGDLIDDFYAEYGSLSGEADTIDADEVITALAKTVADITLGSDAALRQRILEDLTREISKFEAEYANASGSDMRH